MNIDDVLRAEFSTKDLSTVLRDGDSKVFTFPGPIGVTYPERVLTAARYLKILVQRRTRFISTRGR